MNYKFATKAIHAGQEADPTTGAVMTPIYQTSTYQQKAPGDHKGFEYSRGTNPTRKALEDCLAALENGNFGLAFSSGMAATDCVLRLLKPGDEVVTGDDLYGGSYRIFTKVYEPLGIVFKFVNTSDVKAVEDAITDKTKLIWVETPTNPTLKLADIEAIGKVAKAKNILYAVDNTFASPYLQNPLDLGADIVMHSVTKYLGGHSDVVMGALIVNDEELYKQLWFYYNACGGTPGPQDAFLVLRGIKTLHLRMKAHCENGRKVAEYLKNHTKVEKIYWPGFEDHPGHDVAKKQMKDFGGMVSIVLKGADLAETFRIASGFKVFTLAESLGGVESLINHPATMTHGSIPKETREKVGVVDNLLRLSVGIEDAEDLIADLEQALSR
ncbi:cystathionine gamma-synthase [Sphingobacterium cellulitidis]|uniref:cystathionine gamma-synthase n=1 Tax=Sphingobacterium cellulitidis TaxID=1768011 RepID=UPI000B941233|nr:cystathionine gamma-synthase [Sphingobacterium cellulitidis]OYD46227.1 cystathionine gamma-synthase [Sphingobacterium cellulitidis]